MKIAAVTRRTAGDRTIHTVTFERDGVVAPYTKAVMSPPKYFRYCLELRAREADRDIAYQLHGAAEDHRGIPAWRDHTERRYQGDPDLISDEEYARWAHEFNPS